MPDPWKINIFLILACIAVMLPLNSRAAPFCTQVRGIAPECIYVDAVDCRKRATALGGICLPNPREIRVSASGLRYCLLDSSKIVQCTYADYDTCEKAAELNSSFCMDSSMQGTKLDPHAYEPNRKY